MFRLNCMDSVQETDHGFICRNVPMPDMKWRLVEEFGPDCFTETDDGRLLFTANYTDMDILVA